MTVLVLNASYAPLNTTTVKRAVVLVLKEKAEIVEEADDRLRSGSATYARPVVIRLVAYVRIPYRTLRDGHVSRRAVLARDNWECQYCGSGSRLTLDHVVPRSRGGEHVWTNVVTSCAPCNQQKNDRLPKEAGMKLRRELRVPDGIVFVRLTTRRIPPAWERWVAA